MSTLSDQIGGLTPKQRALLEMRLKRGRAATAPRAGLGPRRGEGGRPPLSFAQQRLWFLDHLNPGGVMYNVPGALSVRGPLDVRALESAMAEIVRRHEVLRSTFGAVDGRPVLAVNPPQPFVLAPVDLSGMPAAERDEQVRRLTAEEIRRPFDLARGPLLRIRLLRLGAEDHVIVFTLHHIVSDGWSLGVFISEVSALYAAFREGRPSPLEELPVQYADFAHWQRERLRGETLQSQLAYWRRQLEGPLPKLSLPADRPRSSVTTFRGSSQCLTLAPSLSARVRALSARESVTQFMLLLAAFKALLGYLADGDDILVGTPVLNRNHVEVEGLIGCFINVLVLRTRLGGDPTFRELLGRTRESVLGAFAHQELPFEMLVDEIQPERDLSQTPLFQVTFTMENSLPETPELPQLDVSFIDVDSGTVQFDLTLHMVDTEQGLLASMQYSTELYEPSTIDRFLKLYETLLGRVAAQPETRLSELAGALAEADRQLRLAESREAEAASLDRLRRARRRPVGASAPAKGGLK